MVKTLILIIKNMESLNALPKGFEGPQKRQTEFESGAEKLRYDAGNLIVLARNSLLRGGDEAPSRADILMAIGIVVWTHREDLNKALLKAVNAQLDETEAAQPGPSSAPEK